MPELASKCIKNYLINFLALKYLNVDTKHVVKIVQNGNLKFWTCMSTGKKGVAQKTGALIT